MSFTEVTASESLQAWPAKINEGLRYARRLNIASKSASFTVGADDTTTAPVDWYRCDATGGAITATLPAATGSGQVRGFIRLNGGGNAVTIDGNASETLNGATTQALSAQYARLIIVDAAAGVWDIVES